MSNEENNKEIWEDECIVDEDSNSVVSAKLPYSTKQLKNWIYSNKGKIYSHHLPLFCIDKEKVYWGSIDSSFDELSFMYLSHKEVKRLNYHLIEIKNSNSVNVKRRMRLLNTPFKSASEIRDKSSWEILQDMLQ